MDKNLNIFSLLKIKLGSVYIFGVRYSQRIENTCSFSLVSRLGKTGLLGNVEGDHVARAHHDLRGALLRDAHQALPIHAQQLIPWKYGTSAACTSRLQYLIH